MAIALSVLVVVCAHIHWIDVRWRAVLPADVSALVGLRLALLAAAEVGAFGAAPALSPQGATLAVSADGLAVSWGASALAESALLAVVVVLALAIVSLVMRMLTGKRCLGGGDVQLYAVCCLFLDASGALALLVLSSLGGLAAAGCAVLRGERTFAFAPAIVWSLFAVLLISF